MDGWGIISEGGGEVDGGLIGWGVGVSLWGGRWENYVHVELFPNLGNDF